MSNKDINGFELPWILVQLDGKDDCHEIQANDNYSTRIIIDDISAFTCCLRDAALHLNQTAAEAIRLHIRDAHNCEQWRKQTGKESPSWT